MSDEYCAFHGYRYMHRQYVTTAPYCELCEAIAEATDVAAAVAAEREACAQLAESTHVYGNTYIATAIRARGKP